MITLPVNDHHCLGQITEVIKGLVQNRDPIIKDIVSPFPTTTAYAAWIRSLPQKDDLGKKLDGPKAPACDPPQRIRIPAEDPNCVERAAMYLAGAEFIDPGPERRLETVELASGRHTLPVENGEPVVLDPQIPRNAACGAVFLLAPVPVRLTPRQAVDWIAAIAEEPAAKVPGGVNMVRNAHETMAQGLVGVVMPIDRLDAVALTLALAEREARAWGPKGVKVVQTTAHTLDELDREARLTAHRNAVAMRVGRYQVRPDSQRLGALGRVALRLGSTVGGAVARVYLARLGIDDQMLTEIEGELRHDGLTLGELGKPKPIPGSLAGLAAAQVG